jgi:Protein of unknown function (DUF3592)
VSVGSVYLWMFGLPIAVVAGAALTASALRRRRDRLLVTTGQRAIGHVLESGCDTDDMGGSSYWVRVQYIYDGEAVTTKVPVSHRDQQRYRVGQRVGLTYAPSRPQVVKLDPPEWALRPAS